MTPSAMTRKGLRVVLSLAEADLDVARDDDPPRWTKQEWAEIKSACDWLRSLAYGAALAKEGES